MSIRDVQQLMLLIDGRIRPGTFLSWFYRYYRNILATEINPPIVNITASSAVTREPVFDIDFSPSEQQQIRRFRRSLQPGVDPELALFFPLALETSSLQYFDRQRSRLQGLVNQWSLRFAQAAPHSERHPRSVSHRVFGYGSGQEWNFLNSPEYIPFYYVMMLPPAPYGIEIQIPSIMRNHPDQFIHRRPPHTRIHGL